MATSGKALDERTMQRLRQMAEQGVEAKAAARAMQVAESTARRIFRNVVDKNRQTNLIEDQS